MSDIDFKKCNFRATDRSECHLLFLFGALGPAKEMWEDVGEDVGFVLSVPTLFGKTRFFKKRKIIVLFFFYAIHVFPKSVGTDSTKPTSSPTSSHIFLGLPQSTKA